MNELTIEGKTYISSKRAAEITGYAKDYVGQLCREGRIEARLVGRNWYILEESVREHRFGKEEKAPEAAGTAAAATWNAPRYEAEVPSSIPTLSDRHKETEDVSEIENGENTGVLTEMQAAWQEWFAKKDQNSPAEEQTSDSSTVESTDTTEEETEVVKMRIVEEEIIVEATESSQDDDVVDAEDETDEVPVALHASVQELQDDVLDLSALKHESNEVEKGEVIEDSQEEEGTVIEEAYVRGNGSNILVRTILVALMLVAVVVTTVGTGLVTKYDAYGLSRIAEIKYLAGVIEFYR